MKYSLVILFSFITWYLQAQVTLDADGTGNTYELISSILAPGYNPIEVPDCNHLDFGEHIDEIFDDELGIHVFRFHIHTTPDNDRCINFDRQRNEIKTYDKSPDNLLAVENEKVVYKWKFKLDSAFQSSPNFTHLHQLKSVGGSFESIPTYTLTTRKGNPDRLELRYAETDNQVTLIQKDLAPFLGTWLNVTETIMYSTDGMYEIEISNLSNGEVLLNYASTSSINWRPGASFVRPKWGIYRSLINEQDLRDETLLYANFSIEELDPDSNKDYPSKNKQVPNLTNPVNDILHITNLPVPVNQLQLYNIDGTLLLNNNFHNKSALEIDVASFNNGIYILLLRGDNYSYTKKLLINGKQ